MCPIGPCGVPSDVSCQRSRLITGERVIVASVNPTPTLTNHSTYTVHVTLSSRHTTAFLGLLTEHHYSNRRLQHNTCPLLRTQYQARAQPLQKQTAPCGLGAVVRAVAERDPERDPDTRRGARARVPSPDKVAAESDARDQQQRGGAQFLVVEGGKSSVLGRPEAGCWGHGEPPSCPAGVLGRWTVQGGRWGAVVRRGRRHSPPAAAPRAARRTPSRT